MKVLGRVFRGKCLEALRRAYDRSELDLAGGSEPLRHRAAWQAFVDALFETDWVVYAKPAFGGATAVLRYLGRYTRRVAISNHRLLAFDGDHVTFQWKDYAHGDQRHVPFPTSGTNGASEDVAVHGVHPRKRQKTLTTSAGPNVLAMDRSAR